MATAGNSTHTGISNCVSEFTYKEGHFLKCFMSNVTFSMQFHQKLHLLHIISHQGPQHSQNYKCHVCEYNLKILVFLFGVQVMTGFQINVIFRKCKLECIACLVVAYCANVLSSITNTLIKTTQWRIPAAELIVLNETSLFVFR